MSEETIVTMTYTEWLEQKRVAQESGRESARKLIAKWRKEAHRRGFEGLSGDAAYEDCADELEAALGASATESASVKDVGAGPVKPSDASRICSTEREPNVPETGAAAMQGDGEGQLGDELQRHFYGSNKRQWTSDEICETLRWLFPTLVAQQNSRVQGAREPGPASSESLRDYLAKRIETLAPGVFTDEWNKGYKAATVDAASLVRLASAPYPVQRGSLPTARELGCDDHDEDSRA